MDWKKKSTLTHYRDYKFQSLFQNRKCFFSLWYEIFCSFPVLFILIRLSRNIFSPAMP